VSLRLRAFALKGEDIGAEMTEKMLRRRWPQFGLQSLLAVLFVAALVAWHFRPGTVKPKFALEEFGRETNGYTGEEYVVARIRLTNAGWDSIWLRSDAEFNVDAERRKAWKIEIDEKGVENITGPGSISGWHFAFDALPIRLKPGESNTFSTRVDESERSLRIGVHISDRRRQREKEYWSQRFEVPENLFPE
jgi:hypothetical protein